jgi:hypothetical protein
MIKNPSTQPIDAVPTYLGRGDPAGRFADYYPAWVDNLADDVTLEGSMLDGAVQGADAVRALVAGARQLYDRQDFNFAGPWATTGSSRTTPPRYVAGRSGPSTWSPSTPTGRRSTSQPTTGRSAP